jgi:N-terminal domain of anti-restriction factor ArdC
MPSTRRSLTDAEREQRRAEQRQLVRASIEQLRTSDGWQAYLKARARFPSYSWRNVLLIYLQHPTAERVAGFRAWLDLGYCVRKRPDDVPPGQWAIRIWARCEPSKTRLRAWRDAGGDPDQKPRATYRLVCVYAQDQVDALPPPAKPVPLRAPIAQITGDSHQSMFATIVKLAEEIGYSVVVCDTGRADGTCHRQTREIKVADRLALNGRLAAGIHELAHALVGDDDDAPKLSYAQEELVVESIAWSCCQTVGLDTSANSIPYLTSWAQSASIEVLEQTAAITGRISDRLEAALVAEPTAAHPAGQELIDAAQPVAV